MKSLWGISIIVLVIGAGVIVWGAGWFAGEGGSTEGPSVATSPESKTSKREVVSAEKSKADLAKSLGVDEKSFVNVGGIERPLRDTAFAKAANRGNQPKKSVFPNPGRAPYLKGNENAQVSRLMKEITESESFAPQDIARTRELRAAKSALFLPEPFDAKKYEANPQAYLEKVRPGRVFQPKQPGPDITRLTAVSRPFAKVLQSESVQLRVKADPGAPVAFHTSETGTFENLLKTTTVAANDEGIATATFTLGKGTSGLVNVLAASPVHSDQVRFTFKVELPDQQ